jgi:PEP-CTERM motif
MNARHSLVIFATLALASTQASASVLSASSLAVRSMSTGHAGYLDVNTMQTNLNASLNRAVDETPASASLTGRDPALSAGGGFYVQSTGAGVQAALSTSYGGTLSNFSSSSGDILAGVFRGGLDNGIRNGGFGGTLGHGRSWGTGSGAFGRGSGRAGVAAAPEPSTWLLLGAGIGMLSLFAGLKRRPSETV